MTEMYEIITRDYSGNWSADGIGSPNAFASIEEASAAIHSLIALGDEWRIGTYGVREIGSEYREPGTDIEGPDLICAYCDHQVPREDVPEPTDDEAWALVAEAHNPACKWVATRAHQLP